MPTPLAVDLLVEDVGQELFIGALVRCLLIDLDVTPEIRVVTAQGGRPKLLNEVKIYQRALELNQRRLPDFIVISTDGNCEGFIRRRDDLLAALDEKYRPFCVCAVPDPHVEKWFLADQGALRRVLGQGANLPAHKCDKRFYKKLLEQTIVGAGQTVTLGGAEYAEDLIASAEIAALRTDASLQRFLDDLCGAAKQSLVAKG